MSQLLFDTQLATIVVLHDVIEDSKYTLTDLKQEGMSTRVISALMCLTHDDGQSDAILVKRKDLEHNSDITRLKGIGPKDIVRMEKYHKAFVRLTEAKRIHKI